MDIKTETTQAGPVPDAFAALASEAAGAVPGAAPGAAAAGGAAGEPEKESSAEQEWLMAFEMLKAAPFVETKFPNFHAAMTDAEIKKSAKALGALFDKYKWSVFDWLAKYMIELQAAWVVGCWSYALGKALAVDIAKLRGATPEGGTDGGK